MQQLEQQMSNFIESGKRASHDGNYHYWQVDGIYGLRSDRVDSKDRMCLLDQLIAQHTAKLRRNFP